MNPRPSFLSAAGAFAAAGLSATTQAQTGKESPSGLSCMVYDKDRQKKVTPDEAMNLRRQATSVSSAARASTAT